MLFQTSRIIAAKAQMTTSTGWMLADLARCKAELSSRNAFESEMLLEIAADLRTLADAIDASAISAPVPVSQAAE